jgi:tetratricopeptide (TPR) repeat protein
MEKKYQANQYFKNGNYQKSINIYSEILELDKDNHEILSNRSAAYIKIKKYDLALNDIIKTIKFKPCCGKAWGRLGATLYGQNKIEKALVAYNKANELESMDIYSQMINQINEQLNNTNNTNNTNNNLLDDSQVDDFQFDDSQKDNLFNNLLNSVISNPEIMEKLTNLEFQKKVLSLQNNQMEALKDEEILNIMNELMKNIKL